jgi:hypothetical protein
VNVVESSQRSLGWHIMEAEEYELLEAEREAESPGTKP